MINIKNNGGHVSTRARTYSTPATGLDAATNAIGAIVRAYTRETGRFITTTATMPAISYRKRRRFDALEAFIERYVGAYCPADDWSHA